MTGFWLAAGAMLLVAIALLAVPLWRDARRNGRKAALPVLAVLALVPAAVGLYLQVSTWSAEGAAESAALAAEFDFIERLAQRLSIDPNDAAGWQLLGRSYLEIGDYDRARLALEQAWNRTPDPDDILKLSYAESMIFTDATTVQGLAGALVDEVIASSPGNQRALWWGGFISVERNQPAEAVERWSALLATNPPQEIRDLIREQLAQLAANGAGGSAPAGAAADSGVSFTLDVRVADDIPLATAATTAVLYIAARSPDGGPPLAVEQHPVSAVPGRFVLSEADAMLAGNSIAGRSSVSVVARISQGGGATEQPGDFYGEVEVALPATDAVTLTIDRVVPQD